MSTDRRPPVPPALRNAAVSSPSETETSKGSSDEKPVPGLLSRMACGVFHWFFSLSPVFVLVAFVLGLLYVGSITTISATLDGEAVSAPVLINGEYVGDTPYETRLGAGGEIKIEVLRPHGCETNELADQIKFSPVFGQGVDLTAKFTSYDPGGSGHRSPCGGE